MRLILAPMEGVVDYHMRRLLTDIGGFDRCVTEFVRVTQQVLPRSVFVRHCPELTSDGRTPSGTPVYVQLLGGDADIMAKNAAKAADLGALGIDLNFGCPSKTVNNHDGGSALLKEPARIHNIVKQVRQAVDEVNPNIPVTTKIRLGFADTEDFEQIALGIVDAGANELCVHARTRQDGYKPPAHWHHIANIKPKIGIPLIANGEIWTAKDARNAQQISQCDDLMLGRGIISFPDLARAIRADQAGQAYTPLTWAQLQTMLLQQLESLADEPDKYVTNRFKQWLVYLKRQYPEAEVLFSQIKRLKQSEAIKQILIAD